ncbi:MAG: hypothetical protein DRN21_02160 [Thermoplasmata archaeon]|nr:MAG: hypothetical protein DRN21_02160 [Thermoplasmata archaeon]
MIGDKIYIKNEDGREHTYSLLETYKIINWPKIKFGKDWFPLANNVELMGRAEEKDALGTAIPNFVAK